MQKFGNGISIIPNKIIKLSILTQLHVDQSDCIEICTEEPKNSGNRWIHTHYIRGLYEILLFWSRYTDRKYGTVFIVPSPSIFRVQYVGRSIRAHQYAKMLVPFSICTISGLVDMDDFRFLNFLYVLIFRDFRAIIFSCKYRTNNGTIIYVPQVKNSTAMYILTYSYCWKATL